MSDPTKRNQYSYFNAIQTRWMDNDIYGHINNVQYYSFFDTVANNYLIEQGELDVTADVVGFIVASSCQYLVPISHPATINAAFRVNRLGNSSVEYGLAIFEDDSETASAWGTYTHVFVNRQSNQSVPIPDTIRGALQKIVLDVST